MSESLKAMPADFSHHGGSEPEDPIVQLTAFRNRLTELNDIAGGEFLALAESLQSIASGAGDVSDVSRDAAELAGAGETQGAYAKLENLISEAEQVQTFCES